MGKSLLGCYGSDTMKELVFLDSIDSPVGNIYTILQTESLATVMRTSYKYGYNMAIIPLTKSEYTYSKNRRLDILV